MRSRVIDVALLLGLVVVAGAIMWTLFNLGASPRGAQSPPAATAPQVGPTDPPAQAGRGDGPAVVPIAPGGAVPPPQVAPGLPGGVPATDDDGPAADADGDADADGAADADADGADDADETPAPAAAAPLPPGAGLPEGGAAAAPPVPAGTVAIERLGFSYVTGGPGACGVVLEAWTHVAVSRELLAEYGCGTAVRVTLDDPAGGRSSFDGVIGDTMNPQFARTLNVYVAEDEPAFEYGLSSGTITPLD